MIAAAILAGTLGSGAMVWQGTAAVFSATTANIGNSWTVGSVALSDDDTGAAMFSAAGLVPGSTGSNCITVTYSGTSPTAVKLYVSTLTDSSSLAQYIDLVVDEGTGGGYGSCAGFSGTTIFSGDLATFASTKMAYASGVGSWAPSAPGSTVYRITYTLNASTPSGKQGTTSTSTFQWESQA